MLKRKTAKTKVSIKLLLSSGFVMFAAVTSTVFAQSMNKPEISPTPLTQSHVGTPVSQPDKSPPPPSNSTDTPKPTEIKSAPVTKTSSESSKTAPSVSANQPISTEPKETLAAMDEQFSGSILNTQLWEVMTYPKGYRNNEEQDYRPAQVKVADGSLQITATKDQDNQWHSGEVHSRWAYTYGEFEVRLALSTTGPGVWPAAWLMGTTDSWPDNGEIDIMENINGDSTVFGTLHGGGSSWHWQLQKSFTPISITQFHTYKIVKKPGIISWWVDGVKRGEWLQSQTPVGNIWPFENHKNFGLLNLAIGGNWPGPSNSATPDTITMYVDYFTVKNAY